MTGHTPIYNIPYPDSSTKAYLLGEELKAMGLGVENAIVAAGVPPTSNPQAQVAASEAARDQFWGVPADRAAQLLLQSKGAQTIRTDLGYTEQYYAEYDAALNPGGATPAGWYRVYGGDPDTSWVSCTYSAGFTAGSAMQARVRFIDKDTVEFDGGGSGTFASNQYITFATIPAGYRPQRDTYQAAAGTLGRNGTMYFAPSGKIQFAHSNSTAPTFVSCGRIWKVAEPNTVGQTIGDEGQ